MMMLEDEVGGSDVEGQGEPAEQDQPAGQQRQRAARSGIYSRARDVRGESRSEAEDSEPGAARLSRILELEASGLSEDEIRTAIEGDFPDVDDVRVDPTGDVDADDDGGDDSKGLDSKDELVRIRVDGEDRWATPEEVAQAGSIASLQKELSADRRLELAAAERREIAAERARLERERQEMVEARTTHSPKGGAGAEGDDPDAGDLREISKQLASKFYAADEDELAEALHDTLSKVAARAPKQPDPPAPSPARPSEPSLTTEQIEANRYFASHYGELGADPDAMEHVRNRIEIERMNNPDRSLVDIVKAAADTVMVRVYGRQPNKPDAVVIREERKRESAGATPVVSSIRSAGSKTNRPPVSIDESRKAGLQTLLNKRNQRYRGA